MLRTALAVNLTAGCLIFGAQPCLGALPVQTGATSRDQPTFGLSPDSGTWLSDMMLDRLTIPLGWADQRGCWPFGASKLPGV